MKKNKIILILLAFMGFAASVNAQSALTIDASQLLGSFKFRDSQSNNLNSDYAGILTGASGIGYRYTTGNGIIIRTGLGLRNAGATMVYDNSNYSWDLRYADLKLGAGYIYKSDLVSPYLTLSGYFGYLLRGYQTLNNEDFDIINAESMKRTDYGILVTPGVQFSASETLGIYIEFSYLMGLANLETDPGQKSANVAYMLTAGLSFSFGK
jgi:hypothetical protein